jgi:hypothetical protein
MKIVYSPDYNTRINDHRFLMLEHSFSLSEKNKHFIRLKIATYKLIAKCCIKNSHKFSVYHIKHEDIFPTEPLENAVSKRLPNTMGETVKLLIPTG